MRKGELEADTAAVADLLLAQAGEEMRLTLPRRRRREPTEYLAEEKGVAYEDDSIRTGELERAHEVRQTLLRVQSKC